MKKFIAAILMAVSVSAWAVTDLKSVSTEQLTVLVQNGQGLGTHTAQAVKTELESRSTALSLENIANVGRWGREASEAAMGISRAIVVAAKELGMAVNDFLNTDAGRLAAVFIFWKVFGEGITLLLVSTVVLVSVNLVAVKARRRLMIEERVVLERKLGAVTWQKVKKSYTMPRGDLAFVIILTYVIQAASFLFFGATLI